MIPYDIDPSLHDGAPASGSLDDGFSPRPVDEDAHLQAPALPPEEAMAEKGDF